MCPWRRRVRLRETEQLDRRCEMAQIEDVPDATEQPEARTPLRFPTA
jgi:hypothetical protein